MGQVNSMQVGYVAEVHKIRMAEIDAAIFAEYSRSGKQECAAFDCNTKIRYSLWKTGERYCGRCTDAIQEVLSEMQI